MAGAVLSDISAVMNLVFGDSLANQMRRDVILPNLVRVENDANSTCTWPVKFTGRNTASAKAEGFDAADGDYSTDLRKQATIVWAEYFAFAKVSGLSQALAAATRAGGSYDLLSSELRDAVEELAVLISSDTYAGNDGDTPAEIEGLANAIDSTGTYAGLAQGSYSEWASGEDTLASASLSLGNLRTKLHRKFKDGCGFWPEFVVTTPTVFDQVCALFPENSRNIIDQVTTSARGTVNLKAIGGYRAVEVDGIPYIEDRHCTASTLYAIHSDFLSYQQVPAAGSGVSSAFSVQQSVKALTGDMLPLGEIEAMLARGASRLQPVIEPLGKTGDNMKVLVKWYGQLKLRRRNAAAKLLLT
jgi:hypothetical protein